MNNIEDNSACALHRFGSCEDNNDYIKSSFLMCFLLKYLNRNAAPNVCQPKFLCKK